MTMSNALPSARLAQRMQSKASILIEGLQGTGKSGLALEFAFALEQNPEKIRVIDTENRSADLFEGLTLASGTKVGAFSKVDLLPEHGYAPSNYLALRDMAVKDGCTVCINDSISHAWTEEQGVLQMVSILEQENAKVNKFSAWGNPEVMQEKSNIKSLVRDPSIHVISTVRMREKFTMNDENKVVSEGDQQIMEATLKYEPDLVLHMVKPGTPDGEPPLAEVKKTRYAMLRKDQTYAFTKELIAQVCEYLNEGADPEVLKERQREDYIVSISDILKNDTSKQTKFKMLKKNLNVSPDVKLADMELSLLQHIYKQLAL